MSETGFSQMPAQALAYSIDAWQRSILFFDVMRQRAEQYREHAAQTVPHVLDYQAELVSDGRKLPRPVNYCLVRIVPPEGVTVDPVKRPFVVVDPRAGHGPGIGGFKADSEVGVALKAGHECYFIGFMPEPMDGPDHRGHRARRGGLPRNRHRPPPRCRGQALRDRQLPGRLGDHHARGAAPRTLRTDHRRGLSPLLLGRRQGPVSDALFRRAARRKLAHRACRRSRPRQIRRRVLVQNFENQNPANTLWSKQYNLYSKIDTEASRYLGFERWWGGHVTLNAEEMQFIVEELFVGNKLAAGVIRTSDGTTVDLRNIRSPIVVFCSKGDNITPPQQALDWILDLYDSVDEIRAHGQTIVYTIHETVGHLGIFVSAGVARKEHDEFASNIDMIDVLPPGLYEAILTPKDEASGQPRSRHRQLDHALRGAHARRHPCPRRQ